MVDVVGALEGARGAGITPRNVDARSGQDRPEDGLGIVRAVAEGRERFSADTDLHGLRRVVPVKGDEGPGHERVHDAGRAALHVEGAEPVAARAAAGVPVEEAEAVRRAAGRPDDLRHLADAFRHARLIVQDYLRARLHDHRLLAETLPDVADVRHAVGDDLVGVRDAVGRRPVRIERHAHQVVARAVLLQQAQVPVVEGLVVAVVQVHDHDGLREHALDRLVAGIQEAGVLLRIQPAVAHVFGDLGTPVVPEQAVGGLIADLDPFRRDAVVFQQLQHLRGVGFQVLLHLRIGVTQPGAWDGLVLGVCPAVAVVEIDHDLHPQVPGQLRVVEDILLVAQAPEVGAVHGLSGTAPGLGIDPDAKPDGIQAHLLHQGRDLHRFVAGVVVIVFSAFLRSGGTADVGAEPERLSLGCARCRQQRREDKDGMYLHGDEDTKNHGFAARDLLTRATPAKTSTAARAFCQVTRSIPTAMLTAAAISGWR